MPMTGKPTDLTVEQWKREGIARGARGILVVWDEFPWPPEPYPVFIGPADNINERFAALDGRGMQRVYAVYLLS